MTKNKRKGYMVTLLVLGVTTVVAAFNADQIKKFINDKLPFVASIFNK